MDNNNALYTDDYTIEKIIFVNSAKHAFTELQLDHHLAIFGKNNKGKSATLSGLKIALFPEVNFKHVERKFAFKAKDGTYHNKEKSYQFFFPSSASFIIVQASNPHGKFCIVMYRGVDYHYHRAFIPVAFDEIRYLFFDEQTQDLNRDMSIKQIQSEAKRLDGIITNDEAELVSLMFNGHQLNKRKARFCLIPLLSNNEQSVKKAVMAFTSLFNLTFNIEDKDTLASAIATLIEMGKSRKNEHLDADLHKLSEQHDKLKDTKTNLDAIERVKPKFDAIYESFSDVERRYERYSKDALSMRAYIESSTSSLEKELRDVLADVENKERTLRECKTEMQSAERSLRQASTDVRVLEKVIGDIQGGISTAKHLISGYKGMTVKEVVEILEEELERQQSLLKSLKDEQHAQKKFESLNKDIKDLGQHREMFKRQLKDGDSNFLFRFDDHTADVLYQLAPEFINVEAVDEDFEAAAVRFAGYFTIDETGLYLAGQRLKKRGRPLEKRSQEDLEAEIKKIEIAIEDKRGDLRVIQQSRSSDALKVDSVSKIEKEVANIQHEINTINALGQNESRLAEKEAEMPNLKDIQDKMQHSYEARKALTDDATEHHLAIIKKRDGLQASLRRFGKSLHYYEQAVDRFKVDESVADVPVWAKPEHNLEQDASSLHNDAKQLSVQFDTMKNAVIELMRHYAPESINSDLQHKIALSMSDVSDVITIYWQLFGELEYSRKRYFESVTEHHQLMINQKIELVNARNLLTSFINTVNQEMGAVKISNLREIKLNAKVSVDFENLIDSLSSIDLSESELVDRAIYEQLVDFADKKMDPRTRKVRMESIIEDIQYSYLIDGKDEVDTKGQSGGTTSSITALVISVLLKRITPNYVKLNMPIIIDEIKALDSANAGAMVRQIEKAGFSLLCATPDFDATTVLLTKRFIQLSAFNLSHELMAPECSTLTLIEHIQGYNAQTDVEEE